MNKIIYTLITLVILTLTTIATEQTICPRCHKPDCEYMVGINIAGAEFASHELPGIEGRHYCWPSDKRLDYWQSKGIRLVRLPFLWERLQPNLQKSFDPQYLKGLERTVNLMGQRNMLVILDVHNYAKYRGNVIGSDAVTFEAFADLWGRLAGIFNNNPAVYGYGLMNEPTKCDWLKAAQAAVDAIRKADTKTRIFVANDYPGWATTYIKGDLVEWAEKNMRIGTPEMLHDPANMIRWELHMYMDHDASGTYRKTYQSEIERTDGPGARVGPDLGITRVRPFVEWLKKHNAKGLIGEYSVPANPDVDIRWLVCLTNALTYFEKNCLPSTYWAAGEYWSRGHGYVIGPNGWPRDWPQKDQDRPQLKILQNFNHK